MKFKPEIVCNLHTNADKIEFICEGKLVQNLSVPSSHLKEKSEHDGCSENKGNKKMSLIQPPVLKKVKNLVKKK